MKVRIKFKKYGALRFIGHLDVMRFFQKAMRRAEIPIAFTSGYSPHMIMSFANPLGIGLSSEGEYFDIELKEPISSKDAVAQLNSVMVEGMEVVSFRQIAEEKKMTGMALVAAADYLVTPMKQDFEEGWEAKFEEFLAQNEIRVIKATKRSEMEVDIRPMIYKTEIRENGVFLKLAAGSVNNLKPNLVMQEFCNFMNVTPESMGFHYHRLEMYANINENDPLDFVTLEDLGTEIQ